MTSSESKNEPKKTPPIEELNITQELQKKFPDFFPPEKQSRFFASFRSKELPSIKENAKFIKEYHDLIAKKYKEIQSRKTQNYTKEEVVAEGIKEQNLFKELKELDEKIETLSDKEPEKLNDELYDLSPDHYPQTKILGRSALTTRKKSALEIMNGKELFIFHAMIDLDENNTKQSKLNCTINERKKLRIEKYVLIKILGNQEYKEVLNNLSSNYKNATDKDFIETLNLAKKKEKTEIDKEKKEQKKITNKFAFHLLSNPNNQKPEKILEDINSLKIENISEKDLMDFLKLSKCYSTTEKISTLEDLKQKLENEKQPESQKENNNTTKMLKAVGDYLTKTKEEETKLITKFQDEFKPKSNYEIINSLFEKIKENDLELKIFCKALNEDNKLQFKLEDLELFLKNLSEDKDKKEALITLENTLKIESKINSGNLKILQDLTRENKEELLKQQPPTTTTSLSLGFVPQFTKQIKDLVETPARFGERLFEEMQQKPDTNIFEAIHKVLLEIDKTKTKTK